MPMLNHLSHQHITLDRAQVATRTGLTRKTIRNYISSGRMPAPDAPGGKWYASTIAIWERDRPKRGEVIPFPLDPWEATMRHGSRRA